MTRTVRAIVPEGSTRFTLDSPPSEVDDLLHTELSYYQDGAEHTPQYKSGGWDGIRRLYDRRAHSAPVGLLDRSRSVLESEGYVVTVTDNRQAGGGAINPEWNFDYELREYQERAVADVLGGGGGVVSLPTGAGKTVVALRCIHAVRRRAIVFVHSKELLYQWASRVRDVLGVEPGKIGDGAWSEGPVTVAIMDTLVSRGADDLAAYDLAVYDECHKTSAAETFHQVGQDIDAPLRIGLSATPWRSTAGEELKIEGATGSIAVEVGAEELIDAGHLAEPRWRVVDPGDDGQVPTANRSESYQGAYTRCIVESEVRNEAVARAAADLAADGYSVLVPVERVNHGERLADRIEREHGVSAAFLQGKDTTDRRRDVIGAFEDGDVDVLVSTLIKEGVDLPSINAIVLAEAGKSDVAKLQVIGRALRPANGDHAVIVDFRDRGRFFAEHFDARQEAFADYYGKYGPGGDGGDGDGDPGVETVREWLATQEVPLDALRVHRDTDGNRIVIEPSEYLGDDWDDYLAVMRSTAAIQYDRDAQVNYVRDVDRLPKPLGAEV